MKDSLQQLVKAEEAYKRGELDEVLAILDDVRLKGNTRALFLKGETFYKMQKWGDALNCFLIFNEKEPSNSKANTYIQLIRNILGFRNTDFLNP
jgi:hypothetical protein